MSVGSLMPPQAPLRLIKRCRLYVERGKGKIPSVTRGLYVLYNYREKSKEYQVFYIGVAGVSKDAKFRSSVGRRIKRHINSKSKGGKWTHYSFFEVHDNVSREEIIELEGLFLRIFAADERIELANANSGSKTLKRLSKDSAWKETPGKVRVI